MTAVVTRMPSASPHRLSLRAIGKAVQVAALDTFMDFGLFGPRTLRQFCDRIESNAGECDQIHVWIDPPTYCMVAIPPEPTSVDSALCYVMTFRATTLHGHIIAYRHVLKPRFTMNRQGTAYTQIPPDPAHLAAKVRLVTSRLPAYASDDDWLPETEGLVLRSTNVA